MAGVSPEIKKHVEDITRGRATSFSKSKEIHTDRVLSSPPKRHGTLRRSLSADGPLTVNTNMHQKLNATPGPWQVTDNNVAQSPSLASECSNSSVNSTTEWNVMDSKEAPKTPVLPEAQCPGWTVISSSSKGSAKSSSSGSLTKADGTNSQEKVEKTNQEEKASPWKREKTEGKDSKDDQLPAKKLAQEKHCTESAASSDK